MSGADIVAAIALGARFTLVGRAYLYGLMAGGEAGVDRAIEILSEQVSRTMRLLGVTSLEELTPQHVTQLHRFGRGVSSPERLTTSVTLFPQVTAHIGVPESAPSRNR